MSNEGFLSRWSRRKAQGRQAPQADTETLDPPAKADTAALPPALPASPASPASPDVEPAEPPVERSVDADAAPAEQETAPPKPTMADVERLTRDDSFARFVARDVDPQVRNAAMKKLFSDPHYNVMDGLDIYIDDYGKPDPIPAAMLRLMAQSQALGLFSKEQQAGDGASAVPVAGARSASDAANAAVPPTTNEREVARQPPETETSDDENPDLQLQPDDGDRRAGAGAGTDDGKDS